MSEEEYEALERFSIMTVDGKTDDITALRYIQQIYGREIAVKIWEKFCKRGN